MSGFASTQEHPRGQERPMIRRVALRCLAVGAAVGLFSQGSLLFAQPQIVRSSAAGTVRINPDGLWMLKSSSNTDLGMVNLPAGSAEQIIPGAEWPIGVSSDGLVLVAHLRHDGSGGLPAGGLIAGRWASGVWTAVPPIPGAAPQHNTISRAEALSSDGRVVVGMAYRGGSVGFVYDASESVSTALEHPENIGSSLARAVSADGRVVVGNAWTSVVTGTNGAVVWERDVATGQWSGRFLSAAPGSTALAVSADGSTVVGAAGSNVAGAPAPRGVVWRRVGDSWIPIEIPLPSSPSDPIWNQAQVWPTAVSGDGSVVVGELNVFGQHGYAERSTSFIWTAAQGTRLLADVATAAGLPATEGACLTLATGISIDGRVIVGGRGTTHGALPCDGTWILRLDAAPQFPTRILRQPVAQQVFSDCGWLQFNVEAIGTVPMSYQWRRNGLNLSDGLTESGSRTSGTSAASLGISPRTMQDVGVYDVVISGPGGTVISTPSEVMLDTNLPTPPPNATCTGALTISEGLVTARGCTTLVTDGEASCAHSRTFSLWYRYVPSFTGNARIDTCGSFAFPVTSVHASCDGPELGCDSFPVNDACPGYTGNIVRFVAVQAGVPVYVRVGVQFAGEVRLNIAQAPAQPVNDLCSQATVAQIGWNEASVQEASWEGAESSCSFRGAWDVWYSFTAPELGTLTVNSMVLPYPSAATVTAYASCSGQEIACSKTLAADEFGNRGPMSVLRHLPLSPGQSVLLRVTGTRWNSTVFVVKFIPGPLCIADIYGIPGFPIPDGWASSSDLAEFVAAFVADDPLADVVGIGGLPPADGLVTGDDFNAFIAAFASGCP